MRAVPGAALLALIVDVLAVTIDLLAVAIGLSAPLGRGAPVGSGAGVVADSVPEREFQECADKAQAVVRALRAAEGGLK